MRNTTLLLAVAVAAGWSVVAGTLRAQEIRVKGDLPDSVDGVRSLAWSVNGKTLAAVQDGKASNGEPEGRIKVWDMEKGNIWAIFRTPGDRFAYSVAVSPDGRLVAAGCQTGAVRLWDTETKKEYAILAAGDSRAEAVAFSPDGKTLAAGYNDTSVKLWDIVTKQERATLRGHKGSICAVVFSPDGKMLASACDSVRLWEVLSTKERVAFNDSISCRSMAFAPDGSILAIACAEGRVLLWDVLGSKKSALLKADTTDLRAVAISRDGKLLASGGSDGRIRIWELPSGRHRRTFKHNSWVVALAFSPDCKLLTVGSVSTSIRILDIDIPK
jgi:WD40 repeat protein